MCGAPLNLWVGGKQATVLEIHSFKKKFSLLFFTLLHQALGIKRVTQRDRVLDSWSSELNGGKRQTQIGKGIHKILIIERSSITEIHRKKSYIKSCLFYQRNLLQKKCLGKLSLRKLYLNWNLKEQSGARGVSQAEINRICKVLL